MNEGTELQVLLVATDTRQYSETATLLRNAGYVLLKCTANQVAARTRTFRADAIVIDTEMSETLQLLRSLPASIDPSTVLVISGAQDAVRRVKRGVTALSPAAMADELIQSLDVMLTRRMFAASNLPVYAMASSGAQAQMAS